MSTTRFNRWFASLITFKIIGGIDSVVYWNYSIDRGYIFLAPLKHAVAFHSEGIGLFLLIAMAINLLVLTVLGIWPSR